MEGAPSSFDGGSSSYTAATTTPPVAHQGAAAPAASSIAMFHHRRSAPGGNGGGGRNGAMRSVSSSYDQTHTTKRTATPAAPATAGALTTDNYNNTNSNTYHTTSTTTDTTPTTNTNSNSNKGKYAPPAASPSRSRLSDTAVSDLGIIQAAQRAFRCPEGFKLSTVPPASSANRSRMYTYGVRVDAIEMTHTTLPADNNNNNSNNRNKAKAPVAPRKGYRPNGRFYCLASHGCRMANTFLKISRGSTSSATDHLGMLHGGPKTPDAPVRYEGKGRCSWWGVASSSLVSVLEIHRNSTIKTK